ncbi:TPA: DUF2070 family protein [Candidatus Bathyarchaeota archaeon]|nr:DUF2070 family protein [Candidatus Bathyarchaeota archaeon]
MEIGDSVKRASTHYSILFTFPSHRAIIAALFLFSLIGGLCFYTVTFGAGFYVTGVLFGLTVFFLPSLISDLIVSHVILPDHIILDARRSSALSLFTIAVWSFILIAASIVGRALEASLCERAFVFGFSLALSIRFLALNALTEKGVIRRLSACLVSPALCLLVSLSWMRVPPLLIVGGLLIASLMSTAAFLCLKILEIQGIRRGLESPVPLFRAFASVWMEDEPDLLEGFLEKGGERVNALLQVLGFGENVIRAVIIAPKVHYGPFRSVGSSQLPFIIGSRVEALGRIAFPVHTTVGHEMDLTSRAECEKLVQKAIEVMDSAEVVDGGTPLVRCRSDHACATCQIFGKKALVILTLAPRTTEDPPSWVAASIGKEARSMGIHAIVIDAHNSLRDGEAITEEEVRELERVAIEALRKAHSKPRYPIQAGASHVDPRFTVEDGMGNGGINALVIRSHDQTVAYVLVDGNNMVPGLRERIIESVKELGVVECEVLTTDTHVVNAIGSSRRGYPLLGESIPQQEIVEDVRAAVTRALGAMVASRVFQGCDMVEVRVVGRKMLQQLCETVDWGVRFEKKLLLSLFLPSTIASLFIMLFMPFI